MDVAFEPVQLVLISSFASLTCFCSVWIRNVHGSKWHNRRKINVSESTHTRVRSARSQTKRDFNLLQGKPNRSSGGALYILIGILDINFPHCHSARVDAIVYTSLSFVLQTNISRKSTGTAFAHVHIWAYWWKYGLRCFAEPRSGDMQMATINNARVHLELLRVRLIEIGTLWRLVSSQKIVLEMLIHSWNKQPICCYVPISMLLSRRKTNII